MAEQKKFVERRREFRLPYQEKVIFTDGQRSKVAYSLNFSKGGLFVKTLDPIPVDTKGYVLFLLPQHEKSLSYKARIAHIAFDRQKCEIDCGMGVQFLDVTEEEKAFLSNHLEAEQKRYQELNQLLLKPQPETKKIEEKLLFFPHLKDLDLLELRYRVSRVCTLFEEVRDPRADAEDEATQAG